MVLLQNEIVMQFSMGYMVCHRMEHTFEADGCTVLIADMVLQ